MKSIARTAHVTHYARYRGIAGTAELLPGKGGYLFTAAVSKENRLASYRDPELQLLGRVGEVEDLERVEADLYWWNEVLTDRKGRLI